MNSTGDVERARTVRLAITMGDPAGVGPEVIVKALADQALASRASMVVIGDAEALRWANQVAGTGLRVIEETRLSEGEPAEGTVVCINRGSLSPGFERGVVSVEGGSAAYRYVEEAVRGCLVGDYDAICTAPLNKEALHAAGYVYPGHTELLAHLSGCNDVAMILTTEKLKVVHVTTHVGLLAAIESITPERILKVIELSSEALGSPRGARRSGLKIGVCGINPHAGEGGLFGEGEEERVVEPAVRLAREQGLDVSGPLPADTAFWLGTQGALDLIVAMYHDQGHGPVKVLGLDSGVNITAGLPFVRTSVDHGTAFDLVGTGKVNEASMKRAIQEAVVLVERRKGKGEAGA